MNTKYGLGAGILALGALLAGCAGSGDSPWITLIDGERGMDNFVTLGEADWSAREGSIQAAKGGKISSFLVSKHSYRDFSVRAEFWASDDSNTGIFLRCQDPKNITLNNCYEVNVWDQRPDPTYGTGAIVNIAPIQLPMHKAGGRWNTYEITMRGPHLIVVLNGVKTVDVQNSKLSEGPLALQWWGGVVKFRKLQIQPL